MRRDRRWMFALPVVALLSGAAGPRGEDAQRGGELAIAVLSSRPEMVTGGDALVRVTVPSTVPLGSVTVTLNGADVTGTLRPGDAGTSLTGVVDGLALGENRLVAEASGRGAGRRAALTLVNHPREGPVFSGPYQDPFACETHRFVMPVIGATLPATVAPECSLPTRIVRWFYSTSATTPAYKAWPGCTPGLPCVDPPDLAFLPDPANPSARVPYIVRMEVGTADRGTYELLVLHDPRTDPEPDFQHPPKAWNGKLFYLFGTGCNGGWYHQGRIGPFTNEANPKAFLPGVHYPLSRGYVLASSTLNDNGTNCNDVVAAEAMMATKERVIEEFGPPRYTIAFGLSGGSVQQQMIAENYPGLLDGLVPGGSLPDALAYDLFRDVLLLDTYFARHPDGWTSKEKAAVAGLDHYAVAPLTVAGTGIDARQNCPDTLAPERRFDPVTNPTGVRCDFYSAFRNVYGTDPVTGFVRRAYDDVGVQFGLAALNAGEITKAQFLDLNEGIGGFDVNGDVVARRSEADPVAVRRAYRTGRVTSGGLGLSTIPIVDYRGYSEDTPPGDPHQRFFSFAMRERLRKANGTTENHVMLVDDLRPTPAAAPVLYSPVRSNLLQFAIEKLGEWIERIQADTSDLPPLDKVIRARPGGLEDGCMPRGGNDVAAQLIRETQTTAPSTCAGLYPVHSFPRGVAGESVADDVLKCELKRIDPADYAVTFTAEELARLQAIFPAGVCDWSKRGVGQRPPRGTWLRYGSGGDEGDED